MKQERPDRVRWKSHREAGKPTPNFVWCWEERHYVFPADRLLQDPRSKVARRHHLHETGVQRAVRSLTTYLCYEALGNGDIW